jgi:6-pyruvoyltetrahydropterin/6-carboxytetrahydropterin synthase
VKHRILIARDSYKISCAHMTVFPDGTKERLHGHNYQVQASLELSDISFANMIPFALIKAALEEICLGFRERVLLADRNPHFEIVSRAGSELEFHLCGQRYVLPHDDILLLPIDNVAVEPLAAHIANLLITRLAATSGPTVITSIEISVLESPGQGASCQVWLTPPASV